MHEEDSATFGVLVSWIVGGIAAWSIGLTVAHFAASQQFASVSYWTAFIVVAAVTIPVLEVVLTSAMLVAWRWRDELQAPTDKQDNPQS